MLFGLLIVFQRVFLLRRSHLGVGALLVFVPGHVAIRLGVHSTFLEQHVEHNSCRMNTKMCLSTHMALSSEVSADLYFLKAITIEILSFLPNLSLSPDAQKIEAWEYEHKVCLDAEVWELKPLPPTTLIPSVNNFSNMVVMPSTFRGFSYYRNKLTVSLEGTTCTRSCFLSM